MQLIKPWRWLKAGLFLTLFSCSAHAADQCADWRGGLMELERSGAKGEALISRLFEFEAAADCSEWIYLLGIGLGQVGDWNDAVKEFKTATKQFQSERSPLLPVSYARLAEAHWSLAQSESGDLKNRSVSQAAANANIANDLYRDRGIDSPDWFAGLLLSIDSYGVDSDSDYYAQAFASSMDAYRGSGVVPGVNVHIHFDTNEATLTSKGDATLRGMVGAIKEYAGNNPSARFQVIGHTDLRGSDTHNMGLSERRAATVESVLKSLVPNLNIDSIGMGMTQPRHQGALDDEFINQANRRVEIKVE